MISESELLQELNESTSAIPTIWSHTTERFSVLWLLLSFWPLFCMHWANSHCLSKLVNAVGEKDLVWTGTTGWWNPDDPHGWSQNRGVLWHKCACMWSACEVGVILEHESADENVSPEGTFLWNHHRDKATMQSLQWWSCSCTLQKAAYDLASSWTGPKSGETLHTLCHIFTRNNPKATAPVQVCHFKLPYFFMDPVWWRPCLYSLMLNL